MALVYLMAFGLADAQDNGDKEKVRIHSSKSGNVHTFPRAHVYAYVVHIIALQTKFFAGIRENLFQCMEINWRKASHITDNGQESGLLSHTSLNFRLSSCKTQCSVDSCMCTKVSE